MAATNRPGQNVRQRGTMPYWIILSAVELVLVVRVYAQRRYLGRERKRTLTEMVVAWEIYAPHYIPLPHPNWRNNFSEIKPLVRRRHNADATRTCRTP